MVESRLPFDEADDYLFGRLAPAARRRFEERLARDAALGRHVRELEEGALALVLSAPQLPAPREAWTRIEAALAPECEKKSLFPLFRIDWLWSGWGVAAALAALIVGLTGFHVFGPGKNHRAPALAETPADKTAPFPPHSESKFVSNGTSNDAGAVPAAENNPTGSPPSNQTNLLPGEKNLAEASSHSHHPLQIRRVQGPVAAPPINLAGTGRTTSPAALVQTVTTQAGGQVDFVDLASSGASTSPDDSLVLSTVIAMIQPQDLNGGIYMFTVNTNLFISVDPATLPANDGPLTILALDANDNRSVLGTFGPGTNPVLINLGGTNLGTSLGYLMVSGATNIIGYFPP
jgi:hypothetical protein